MSPQDVAVTQLVDLKPVWRRTYPHLWDSDAPPIEVPIKAPRVHRLPIDPGNVPTLHRTYVDAAKHIARASRRLGAEGLTPVLQDLLAVARPLPPRPDRLEMTCTTMSMWLLWRSVRADEAWEEIGAAHDTWARLDRTLLFGTDPAVHPPRVCDVEGCERVRDGRHRRCRTCRGRT